MWSSHLNCNVDDEPLTKLVVQSGSILICPLFWFNSNTCKTNDIPTICTSICCLPCVLFSNANWYGKHGDHYLLNTMVLWTCLNADNSIQLKAAGLWAVQCLQRDKPPLSQKKEETVLTVIRFVRMRMQKFVGGLLTSWTFVMVWTGKMTSWLMSSKRPLTQAVSCWWQCGHSWGKEQYIKGRTLNV